MLTPPQRLLLDLISSRPVSRAQIEALSDKQWAHLKQMSAEHRLESVLHYQIKKRELSASIPTAIKCDWAEQYRQTALNVLLKKRLLLYLKDVLDVADIPFLALKGSWLAWQVYPDPALRPMRDVDILVRKDDAIRAFERLSAEGFEQKDCLAIPLDYLLERGKHLPGLVCPKTRQKLEIHSCLRTPDGKQDAQETGSEFDRLVSKNPVLVPHQSEIQYPSPTDSLLHIITHAVDDHFFNNGPIVILDVYQILQRCQIDWPLFWSLVEKGGWSKSVGLMFDMVEYYHGDQPIDWRGRKCDPAPANVIEAAAAISLQALDAKEKFTLTVGLLRNVGLKSKIAHFVGKLLPSRFALAEVGNVPAESTFVFLAYPKWFFRSLHRFFAATQSEVSPSGLVSPVVAWLHQ